MCIRDRNIPIRTIGLDRSNSRGSDRFAETVETNAEMIARAAKAAAPIAKKLFKLIIDRHELRNKQSNFERITI